MHTADAVALPLSVFVHGIFQKAQTMTLYFLGGGNMAAAIIGGLQAARSPQAVHVAERGAQRRQILTDKYGVAVSETLPPLNADDVLILAVKPQDMQAACENVETGGALVLSLAAGLAVDTLSHYLGGTKRIIRVMPNTPAAIGQGISGLFAGSGTNTDDRNLAQTLMGAVGQTVWLEQEEQMHALTGISGSGSGYVFYLMDALFQAALAQGFEPQQARLLVQQTFQGAAALAGQTDLPFAQLQDQVTSKGGTTIAAIDTFRQHQVAAHIAQGVQAAAERSRQMQAEFQAA